MQSGNTQNRAKIPPIVEQIVRMIGIDSIVTGDVDIVSAVTLECKGVSLPLIMGIIRFQ
jgi:hypothetical protein